MLWQMEGSCHLSTHLLVEVQKCRPVFLEALHVVLGEVADLEVIPERTQLSFGTVPTILSCLPSSMTCFILFGVC